MSVYEQILDEIVAWLKGDSTRPALDEAGIEVMKSPDVLTDSDKLHPRKKGRIRASFIQDRFGTDEHDTTRTVDSDAMDSVKYFDLSIESRKRYGSFGAIHIGQLVLRMLLGYRSETIGGSMYAFGFTFQEFRDDIWYYRVVVRWKELPLIPLESFRVTGDEDTGYFIREINFEPEYINVIDGQTPGYLQYFVDDQGNTITVPEGYVLIKSY